MSQLSAMEVEETRTIANVIERVIGNVRTTEVLIKDFVTSNLYLTMVFVYVVL